MAAEANSDRSGQMNWTGKTDRRSDREAAEISTTMTKEWTTNAHRWNEKRARLMQWSRWGRKRHRRKRHHDGNAKQRHQTMMETEIGNRERWRRPNRDEKWTESLDRPRNCRQEDEERKRERQEERYKHTEKKVKGGEGRQRRRKTKEEKSC